MEKFQDFGKLINLFKRISAKKHCNICGSTAYLKTENKSFFICNKCYGDISIMIQSNYDNVKIFIIDFLSTCKKEGKVIDFSSWLNENEELLLEKYKDKEEKKAKNKKEKTIKKLTKTKRRSKK